MLVFFALFYGAVTLAFVLLGADRLFHGTWRLCRQLLTSSHRNGCIVARRIAGGDPADLRGAHDHGFPACRRLRNDYHRVQYGCLLYTSDAADE